MTAIIPPKTPPSSPAPDPSGRRGLSARVSLGKVFAPVPSEFLLIASTALLLTGFGLVMVLSATSALNGGTDPYEHVIKQGIFALLGVPLMFVASRMPVAFWRKIAWVALIGATAFQLLVFVPGLGVNANGEAMVSYIQQGRTVHVLAYGDFFNEYLNGTDLTTNPANFPIVLNLFGVLHASPR